METTSTEGVINAPVIALDLGHKRVGVAVTDSLSISITRLAALQRTNWKQLLMDVVHLIQRLDAKTVVIGLPLRLDGSYGEAAELARSTAAKFARSLDIPVYMQDERLTSAEAEGNLLSQGHKRHELSDLVDSESAAIILNDFLQGGQKRVLLPKA
jgi:putative holliday junction resolvase